MLLPTRTGPDAATRTESTWRAETMASDVWIVAVLIAIGAALRFGTIASQSYWLDEATTVHEMHLSFGAMLHQVHVNETTPPLYFIVAWLWAKLFGTSEAGLRSLSALLGTAAIPITYLCGRELVSRAAGLVAAALATVSPFLIWYSQEARSYMLFTVLCGLSFWLFARSLREPSRRNLVWWAVASAGAVLTHFFAGFLVAPEGVWLVLKYRNRATLIAAGAVAVVQVAILPLAIGDTSHPLQWIKAFPLAIRIKQVPVDLGLGSLYQSSLVSDGLLGAALLAAAVAALLYFGGEPQQRRGAIVAAAIAAVVLLVPLVLAELGRDYLVSRNFAPAWIPLAVVLGAACTVPRARSVGAALAVVLLVAFVYAGVRIGNSPQYQRPDWRGVAAALGPASGSRAILAYDSGFAAQPLTVYLHGVPWSQPAQTPVTVSEVDVVGSVYQQASQTLPAGARLLSSKVVKGGFLVDRFAVPGWRLTPAQLAARAPSLLGPAGAAPAVLLQNA
ncbi:MAG: glycosyltransferase family 39 protein [Solirubrobacteraceae bacterium]